MLEWKCTFSKDVKFCITVDAERSVDATTLCKAWALTRGIRPRVICTELVGGSPARKAGVRELEAYTATYEGTPAAAMDFSDLERRILALPEYQQAALEWLKNYSPTGRVIMDCPTRKFWWKAPPDEESPRHAKFVDGRGYVNIYQRADGKVRFGNVYVTREEAQRAAKYPEANVVSLVTWETKPRPAQPQTTPPHVYSLTEGQLAHLGNRLRTWANMDMRAKVKVYRSINGGSLLNISIGCPEWQYCLDQLRRWLDGNNVPHWNRRGSTTVVELDWDKLAPLVWPL